MSVMILLILLAARLAMLAVDIATFFILIRLACRWYRHDFLITYDHAGGPLVNYCSRISSTWWFRLRGRYPVSEPQRLAIALLGLSVFRLVLSALIGLR